MVNIGDAVLLIVFSFLWVQFGFCTHQELTDINALPDLLNPNYPTMREEKVMRYPLAVLCDIGSSRCTALVEG